MLLVLKALKSILWISPPYKEITMTFLSCKWVDVPCSGAGKSTVAAVISRFYVPDYGDVLLNGQSAESFTRGEWARAISVVQQEPVLFGGENQAAYIHHLSLQDPALGTQQFPDQAWGLFGPENNVFYGTC